MPTHESTPATVHWILIDLSAALAESWRQAFAGTPVEVRQGSIFGVSCDALVSPANSFGFMDGGLDLRISQELGWHVEQRVRDRILNEHRGELPVGQAFITPTDNVKTPFIVTAPTMRVPSDVSDTVNAYLAFRAILEAVEEHNGRNSGRPVTRVAVPGLGTGEGRMTPSVCARQMRHAWDAFHGDDRVEKGGLAAGVRNHVWLLARELE